MTDCVYQIGTIQGKYQPDGILGYIGDDYILESLGGQSTFTFSVPQNEDPITDASFTQSSLGKAAKHRMFVARFFFNLVYNTDLFTAGNEKVNGK